MDKNATDAEALQKQVDALEAAATTAKSTAEQAAKDAAEAKKNAEAAKAAGDKAKEDAEKAKEDAANALEAAASAKEEAINAAIEAVQRVASETYATKAELAAAVAELSGRIEGIETGLSTLETTLKQYTDEAVAGVNEDLLNAIEDFNELKSAFDTQKAACDKFQENTGKELTEIKNKLTAIDTQINTVGGLKDRLESVENAAAKNASDLAEHIEAFKAEKERINGEFEKVNAAIKEVSDNLDTIASILSNRLTSITLLPEFRDPYQGVAINFYSLEYAPMEANENAVVENDIKKFTESVSKNVIAKYHFNPRSFNTNNATYAIDGIYTKYAYSDINGIDGYSAKESSRSVETGSDWVTIVGSPARDPKEATQNFTLKRGKVYSRDLANETNNELSRYIALQATMNKEVVPDKAKDVVITSDYAYVCDIIYKASDLHIGEYQSTTFEQYPETFKEAYDAQPMYQFAYNEVFNWGELVSTELYRRYSDKPASKFDEANYGLTYRYSVAEENKVSDGETETDQQEVIKLVSGTEGTFEALGGNSEAIGRTPILKVELVDGEKVVRRAFVKVQITANKTADLIVPAVNANIIFKSKDTKALFTFDENQMRENVYRILSNGHKEGISHSEFWSMYDENAVMASVVKDGENYSMSVPTLRSGDSSTGTATKKIVWEFNHEELGEIGEGGKTFVGSLVLTNKIADNDYPANITFKFTVHVELPEIVFAENGLVPNDRLWVKDEEGNFLTYVSNVNVPKDPEASAYSCQFRTLLPQAYSSYEWDFANEAHNETEYVVTLVNGSSDEELLSGVQIDGDVITLDKDNDKVKEALNGNGLTATVSHIAILDNGDVKVINTFNVMFIRPVNLNVPAELSVFDAKTGGDLIDIRQHDGLLTDWAGNIITKKEWGTKTEEIAFWEESPIMVETVVREGYYKLKHEGSINYEYTKNKIHATTSMTLYRGSVTVDFYKPGYVKSTKVGTKTFNTVGLFLTKNEVVEDLRVQVTAHTNELVKQYEKKITNNFENKKCDIDEEQITAGTEVTYNTMKVIKETNPVYEWVKEVKKYAPKEINERPSYNGTTPGQRDGMWVWTVKEKDSPVVTTPNNYWKFYGKFEEIKFDLDGVTTNLPNKKLPSEASLVRVKGTESQLRYENIDSPIQESFMMEIPVELTYGWGTIHDIVKVVVNPAPTISK